MKSRQKKLQEKTKQTEADLREDLESAEAGPSDTGPDETEALIEQLRTERDEALDKYRRALADHQNYIRRARANEVEALRQGAEGVARSVLTVLDHFDLALGQNPSQTTAEHIVAGVRVIRDELWKALTAHGAGLISPAPGDEFDPNRHEAVLQQESEDVDPGRIVSVLQIGYTLGDRVIRPAKVAIRACAEPDAAIDADEQTTETDGSQGGS